MPSVNIQFHMLFDELLDFVAYVSSQYSLGIELERFYPKAVRELHSDADLPAVVSDFGHVDRIWLLCKLPRSKKSERFMLNVGRQRDKRLQQADLGAGTNKAQAFEVLKKVASDLKRRTKGGIWVVNENGCVGYVKNFRISEGATKAARAGKIDLVGIGFTQLFQVDPPETKE